MAATFSGSRNILAYLTSIMAAIDTVFSRTILILYVFLGGFPQLNLRPTYIGRFI